MPRNGSGTYSLPAGNPVVSGTTIQASWANSTLADISTELTGSLARNGAGGMLGALRGVDGTVSVPAFSFTSETTSGFYRAGTGDVRFAMAGADIYTVTTSGIGIGTSSIGSGTRLEIRSANTITDSRGILAINSTNAAAANLGGSISFGGETGQATTPYVFGAISGRYEGSGYAGYLQLSTTTSGGVVTERARIDSSGNLGIGTSSPAFKFDAQRATAGTVGRFFSTGGTDANISIKNNTQEAIFGADSTQSYLLNAGAYPWTFWTSNTERARITSGGDLLVGTTTSKGLITVEGSGAVLGLLNTNVTSTGATRYHAVWYENGTERGSVTSNGTSTAYNTSSDRRLKENIQPADDAGAVIDAIEVVQHDWKAGGHTRYGVIAQDLNAVAPEAVTQGDDGDEIEKTWGVDYSKLVPLLIKEIQSLRARVAALEAA